VVNQSVPTAFDKGLAELQKKLKEHPELASVLKPAIEELEAQRKEAMEEYTTDKVATTTDPASLLKRLKALAINHKTYSGWTDIGNGLFAVTEAPRYSHAELERRLHNVKIPVESRYTWGVITETGSQLLPPQYGSFNTNPILGNCYPDEDVMFLYKRESDGSVHSGAVDYSGRVRIPFIYDKNRDDVYRGQEFVPFEKSGKIGWVSINGGTVITPFEYVECSAIADGWLVSKDGKHYGFISRESGTLVVPDKYIELCSDKPQLKLLRADGKVDVFDDDFVVVSTENASE